jgi:hypothetical protein
MTGLADRLLVRDARYAVPMAAARHEHLTDDEQRRQRALDRSWAAAQESLSDEDLVADLRARIERLRKSDAPRLSGEEFLAQTDIDD